MQSASTLGAGAPINADDLLSAPRPGDAYAEDPDRWGPSMGFAPDFGSAGGKSQPGEAWVRGDKPLETKTGSGRTAPADAVEHSEWEDSPSYASEA